MNRIPPTGPLTVGTPHEANGRRRVAGAASLAGCAAQGQDAVMPLFRRKRDHGPVEPGGRAPETGVKYKDLAVLAQLMESGADLKQPRHALYYLYFAGRKAAEAAGEEARARGFEAAVREPLPEYPDQWSLICEQHGVVLDLETVRANGDFFESLAQSHHGEYDGWEASV